MFEEENFIYNTQGTGCVPAANALSLYVAFIKGATGVSFTPLLFSARETKRAEAMTHSCCLSSYLLTVGGFGSLIQNHHHLKTQIHSPGDPLCHYCKG